MDWNRNNRNVISNKKAITIVQCVGELEILKDQKPENVVEERDSLVILLAPKESLKPEYIDEIIFNGEIRPENEIQIIDQMEVLKTEKPENIIENIVALTT